MRFSCLPRHNIGTKLGACVKTTPARIHVVAHERPEGRKDYVSGSRDSDFEDDDSWGQVKPKTRPSTRAGDWPAESKAPRENKAPRRTNDEWKESSPPRSSTGRFGGDRDASTSYRRPSEGRDYDRPERRGRSFEREDSGSERYSDRNMGWDSFEREEAERERQRWRNSAPSYRDGVERELPRRTPRTKGPAQKLAPEVPEEMVERLVDRKKKSTRGMCYGCGFPLQTDTPLSAGYVPLEKFEVKKVRKQTDRILCERCQALSNGAMIPGVDDQAVRVRLESSASSAVAGEGEGEQSTEPSGPVESTITPNRLLVSPDQLRQDLQVIAGKRAIVLLLVDLLDASGSFFNHVRELVGKNPVVLVGTKFDVLPKGTEPEDVREWLARTAEFKRLNVIGTFVTSSRSGEGIPECVGSVMRERKGRDVFVLGAANVGKTAFLRAVMKEMGSFASRNFNPAAIQASKYAPVESPMPGTTLSFIPLKAFDADSALFDTPGLHLAHRLPHMLTPEENRQLAPSGRMKPYVPPVPFFLAREAQLKGRPERASAGDEAAHSDSEEEREGGAEPDPVSDVCASYYWGGLVRIDVLSGPPQTSLAFYGVAAMRVRAEPLQGPERPAPSSCAPGEPHADAEALPFGSNATSARGGLRKTKDIRLRSPGHRGAVLDIAVSGVPGWVTLFAPGRGDDVHLRVWAPRGVEVYQRPPLPVPNPTVSLGAV